MLHKLVSNHLIYGATKSHPLLHYLSSTIIENRFYSSVSEQYYDYYQYQRITQHCIEKRCLRQNILTKHHPIALQSRNLRFIHYLSSTMAVKNTSHYSASKHIITSISISEAKDFASQQAFQSQLFSYSIDWIPLQALNVCQRILYWAIPCINAIDLAQIYIE